MIKRRTDNKHFEVSLDFDCVWEKLPPGKRYKWHFRASKFRRFLGEHVPRLPLKARTFSASQLPRLVILHTGMLKLCLRAKCTDVSNAHGNEISEDKFEASLSSRGSIYQNCPLTFT